MDQGPIESDKVLNLTTAVYGINALKDAGYEAIMINSNPETVSTDYDTADKLYFEPLSWYEVKSVLDREKPDSVLIQLGGQTPLS